MCMKLQDYEELDKNFLSNVKTFNKDLDKNEQLRKWEKAFKIAFGLLLFVFVITLLLYLLFNIDIIIVGAIVCVVTSAIGCRCSHLRGKSNVLETVVLSATICLLVKSILALFI